jgi:hypothetical protein
MEEWDGFLKSGPHFTLRKDHFVESGGKYFKPALCWTSHVSQLYPQVSSAVVRGPKGGPKDLKKDNRPKFGRGSH